MPTVYAVTHTEATHHVEQRVGGWYDSELTPQGRAQALAIGRTLRSRTSATPRIFSSDLKRAAQTAAAIAEAFSVGFEQTRDLRELGCGVAEGRPKAWLQARIVAPTRPGHLLDHRICAGAETRREAAQRIYRFMQPLCKAPPEVSIVVTHGGALTFVIAAWLGVPIEALDSARYAVESGSISSLELDPEWGERRLASLNETTHLAQVSASVAR